MVSILAILLIPEATTNISRRPNESTVSLVMALQFSSEDGRRLIVSTCAPKFLQSFASFSHAPLLPAASTNLQPAPANALEAIEPNAPDAPTISAAFPFTSNNEYGLLVILFFSFRINTFWIWHCNNHCDHIITVISNFTFFIARYVNCIHWTSYFCFSTSNNC